jgi:hypothetical protein
MPGRVRTRIQARRAARWGGADAASNGVAQPRQGLLGGGGPLRSMFAQVMDGTKYKGKSIDGPNSGAREFGEQRLSRKEWEDQDRNQDRAMSRREWEQECRNNLRDSPREMNQTERWVNRDQYSRRDLADVDQNSQRNLDQSERYVYRYQAPREDGQMRIGATEETLISLRGGHLRIVCLRIS